METIYAACDDGFILADARYESAAQLVQLQGPALRRWPVAERVGRATFQGHIVAATYEAAREQAVAHLTFTQDRARGAQV